MIAKVVKWLAAAGPADLPARPRPLPAHHGHAAMPRVVAERLSALMTEDYLEERAARGSRERFEAVLRKVPSVEPEERDRLE